MEDTKEFVVIEVEEIKRLNQRRRDINKHTIDQIMLVDEDGNKIEITEEFIAMWKYSGLLITDLEYVLEKDGKPVTKIDRDSR